MDKLAERLGVALLIILAIGAISWAGKVDQELEEDNDTHYCEMVKLFKELIHISVYYIEVQKNY